MIEDDLRQGIDLGEERAEYAFDLNEFFATNEGGRFVHEEEVRRFLYALRTNEKYPYSTPALRAELTHTLWLLNRVASAKALAKLLQNDPVFADYEIVLAAGDGALDDVRASEAAYDRVRAAIRVHKANEDGNRNERVLAVKDLVLYPGRYEVRVKGELVELTKKEYSLLEYMLRNKPNVLTRDQILQMGKIELNKLRF